MLRSKKLLSENVSKSSPYFPLYPVIGFCTIYFTVEDWGIIGRVITKTLDRAFNFLFSLQRLGRVFEKLR